MSIAISSQVASIYIRKCLENSTSSYQKAMEQLSSGSKFTSMGDDPVGISTSTDLEVEINFNSRIQTNISLGNDMLSMAEGYQEDILSNLQRIRDLTIQANSGTYSAENKDAILNEIQSRLSYINDTADSANFNDTKLLDGLSADLYLKIGPSSVDTINIGSTFIDAHTDALGISITGPMTDEDWSNYLTSIDNATITLTNNISKIGSYINRLDTVSDNLTSTNQNLTQYKSNISDADVAEASADMVKYQILQQAATNIFVQANQVHQLIYSLLGASS